jgi:hypothetical protein
MYTPDTGSTFVAMSNEVVTELTPEEIEQNWKRFCGFLDKLGDRSEPARAMVDDLGERLCLCPGSSKLDFHNCFPGGLVDHSLRVLTNAVKLCKTFGWQISTDSLIIGCLFHDLGKVGDHKDEYYLPNDSSWHVEKLGQVYKCNKDMQFMTVPDRGVFLCSHYGLKLTQDEFLAIRLNDGMYDEANSPYGMKEPMLADAVHLADLIATKQEKGQL